MKGCSVKLTAVLLTLAGCSGSAQTGRNAAPPSSQIPGTPELTVQQASKIPPFPPRDVSVSTRDGKRVVSWELSPLENVTLYRVYRKSGKADFAKIGEVKAPPYFDAKVLDNSEYAVSAVNSYGAESPLAKPEKTSKPKQ